MFLPAPENVTEYVAPPSSTSNNVTVFTDYEYIRNIGLYADNVDVKSHEDRYNILCNPWLPNENYKFPCFVQGKKNHSFKLNCIKNFPSISNNHKFSGVFRRPYVLFSAIVRDRNRGKLGKLVTAPLSSY
ncbi:hypothetical protein NPIL_266771 [Nephila pilipes]|uniref:Uncharacterized protein n=1 Tax=Nephila pilipes TaxID=299642 RepID=A0A8X6Q5K4_NEPPI|nr:hypothetical protein NPIL_266771 [Nephila pilipes]